MHFSIQAVNFGIQGGVIGEQNMRYSTRVSAAFPGEGILQLDLNLPGAMQRSKTVVIMCEQIDT